MGTCCSQSNVPQNEQTIMEHLEPSRIEQFEEQQITPPPFIMNSDVLPEIFLNQKTYEAVEDLQQIENEKEIQVEDLFKYFPDEIESKKDSDINYDLMKTIMLEDGTIIKGNAHDGVINGMAKIIMLDGSVYTGQVKDNKRQGKGIQTYYDGSIYQGYFFENLRHGTGEMKYPDGSTFKGRFEDEKRTGYGEMKYSDGSVYEGFWLNDKQHGEGKFITKEGIEQHGWWDNGLNIQDRKISEEPEQ